MQEVAPGLYIGTSSEARYLLLQPSDWSVVNVAKTVHMELHGWSQPDRSSPYYVIHEEAARWISVNWVDAPRADLFNYRNNGVGVVKQVLSFIQRHQQLGKNILISCDQGQSRSPSVALLYLAKIRHTLPDTSFADAATIFMTIYPAYQPGAGITAFLVEHWHEI